MTDILIGTSGYDHPELVGSFYPAGLKRKDFLEYYSTKFNALELNSTFYGMPTPQRIQGFYERSHGRLKFSVKLTRTMTHEIAGAWKSQAESFKNAMVPFLEKNALATILVQFPESFRYEENNRFYLSRLLSKLQPLPSVVEFRHRSWIRESVFEGLEKRKAGIVFCDMPQLKNLPDGFSSGTPFIGPNAYIRLHGRNADGWYSTANSSAETHRYDYEYSIEELKSFIPIINSAREEGRTVQLYFNNHPKGTGFMNAMQIKGILGGT